MDKVRTEKSRELTNRQHYLIWKFISLVFQPTTSEKSRSRSPIDDLIKCFCGVCESFFKRKHVVQALKTNEHGILREEDLRVILKKFIDYRKSQTNIPLSISRIVDCFELCDAILRGNEDLEDRKDDLEELCFNETWEERLSDLNDDQEETEQFLKELMAECGRRLGEDSEYKKFRDELLKKLNHSSYYVTSSSFDMTTIRFKK